MTKLLRLLAVLALALVPVGLAVPAAAAPTPLSASCGSSAPRDLDGSAYRTATTAANIRTGSNVNCTSIGETQSGDRLDYYCWTANSSFSWTYLRDVRTGKKGWVRDDLLPNAGSNVFCGF